MLVFLLVAVFAIAAVAQQSVTAGGILVGRLVDPYGRPLPSMQVSLQPVPATEQQQRLNGNIASEPLTPPATVTAITDKNGRFVFFRLPAGTYRVIVVRNLRDGAPAGLIDVESEAPLYVTLRENAQGDAFTIEPQPQQANLVTVADDVLAESASIASQATTATPANSTPGDRADTPGEAYEHDTRVAPEEALTLQGPSEDHASLASAGHVDALANHLTFRSGARGSAAAGGSTLYAGAPIRVFSSRGLDVLSFARVESGDLGVTVRSATADLHGGGGVLFRASASDASNPYALVTHYHDGAITSGVVKPPDTDVQAAARLGFAPLAHWSHAGAWRERLLAFASLDARVRNAPVESTPATPSFYALTPMQQALLGTRGVSSAQTSAALDYLDGLTGSTPRSETRLLGFARGDLQAGTHDSVAVTFNALHRHAPAGATFDQLAEAVMARGRASVGDSEFDETAVAAQWVHTFALHYENGLHAQWVHAQQSELPRAPLPQEPAISPGGQAPEVELAPEGFTFGTPADLDRSAYPDEHWLEVADTAHALLGTHVLTFGGEWIRAADDVNSLRNENGTFLYDSGDMNGRAGGLVDWITDATFNVHAYPNGGCPSITATVHDFCFRTYTQSFGVAQTSFVTHHFAGFAQDAFSPFSTVRISLGARYEYTLLPLPQQPNNGLDASLRALALPAPLAGFTGAFPEDRNNAGPRVGFAWAPREGRWFTVHAGYGWFFGQLPGATLRAALAQTGLPSGIEQTRITPATEVSCPQVAQQGFGYPCAFGAAPPSAVAQTENIVLFSSRFRLPVIQRMGLSVEHAWGKHLLLRASYNGAVGTQLPTSTDINIAPATSLAHFALQGGTNMQELSTGRAFALPLYTARRLAGYGPITAITSQANAAYNAGTLAALLRAWHGVSAQASVTYSRTIDDNPQTGAQPRVNGSFDPFAVGYDKGLADVHVPLRFVAAVSTRTHLPAGPLWLQHAASGWLLAATGSAASGAPYSYDIFGGARLLGGYSSINGAGGAVYLPTVGRNTLHLPARSTVDLRVERGALVHGLHVSGFAQAANLFNTRSLQRVETRAFLPGVAVNGVTSLVFQDASAIAAEGVTTPAFGTATSSTGGFSRERQVALGARVEF